MNGFLFLGAGLLFSVQYSRNQGLENLTRLITSPSV